MAGQPCVGGKTAQVVRELRALKRRLKRKIRVDRAILFGSRARGGWLLTSDADLMIVSRDFETVRFVERSAEVLRHWRGRVDLEVFCYTAAEIVARHGEIGIITQALAAMGVTEDQGPLFGARRYAIDAKISADVRD